MSLLGRLRELPAAADAGARARRIAPWAVVALALALRLVRLGYQPLWWDEGWSLYFASSDLGSLLRLTAVDIHPPLYYLLLRLWSLAFGAGPVSVRLLSVFAGTASVPLLYLAGRRLFGTGAGLLAALLLAVSPFHVYYSQEVRMYGLVALLGLGAFLCADRLSRPDPKGLERPLGSRGGEGSRGGAWLGYVLTASAALYTQYYAAFLLVGLNLAVFAHWLRRRPPAGRRLAWLGAQAAVAALYAPWLWYAGPRLLSYARYKVGVEADVPAGFFSYLGRHLAALGWGHAEGALASWWWLGCLPPVLLVACLLFAWRGAARPGDRAGTAAECAGTGGGCGGAALLAALCALILLAGFAVNLAFPFDAPRIERQLLLALPIYLLACAAALSALWQRRRGLALLPLAAALLLAGVSLGFFYAVPRYPEDDYRPLAARLRALARPSDALVAVHPWQVGYFRSYLPAESRPALVLTPREVLPRERQIWAGEPARMASDLDALLVEHGRLWLPTHQAMGRVLEDRVEAYLAEHAYPALGEWHNPNTWLTLYAGGAPLVQPFGARFGDRFALEAAGLGAGPAEAGRDVVPVELTWRVLPDGEWIPPRDQPGLAYIVGLRLVEPGGRVWAQRDAEPGGGRRPFSQWPVDQPGTDRHGLLVPAGTPPGDYHVALRIYRGDDLSVLPVTFEGGSGGEVILGTLRVVRPATPPPLEALPLEQPLREQFGALRLLGYTLPPGARLLPGEALPVDLYWQALREPGEDLNPRLRLLDGSGAAVGSLTEKPVAGRYPTAWWQAGELVRDPHDLPIPAGTPPGLYRLSLGLVRAADGRVLEGRSGRESLDLGQVEVRGREHRFDPPRPQVAQVAAFGGSVELVGYDLRGAAQPGGTLEVTLHWHALATPERAYRAFVHVLDAGGRIVAQHDGVPGEGEAPARGWLPGEYLADRHLIPLPADLPAGGLRLEAGLYDPATGQRPAAPVPIEVKRP